jgi:hypothetical protein
VNKLNKKIELVKRAILDPNITVGMCIQCYDKQVAVGYVMQKGKEKSDESYWKTMTVEDYRAVKKWALKHHAEKKYELLFALIDCGICKRQIDWGCSHVVKLIVDECSGKLVEGFNQNEKQRGCVK